MIDLGKSKKVTAVLKLFYHFWKGLETPGVIILRHNFTFVQYLIHRTQYKLGILCDFDCYFTFFRLSQIENKKYQTLYKNQTA